MAIARKQVWQATVANIAALVALVVTDWDDGAEVYVETLRSSFVLSSIVVDTPVACAIVNSSVAGRQWYRQAMPRMWNEQTTFYLDGSAGNDENSGLVGSPIKTVAELERRTYIPGDPRPNFTVELVGDSVERKLLKINTGVTFNGALTAIHSGVAIDAVTQYKMSAPCARQAVTSAALTFGASNYLRLSNDGGATFYQSGWAVDAKGSSGANVSRTKIYENAPSGTLATLSAADTAYEYMLFAFDQRLDIEGFAYVEFNNLIFSGVVRNGFGTTFNECVIGQGGFNSSFIHCSGIVFDTCRMGAVFSGDLGSDITFWSCSDAATFISCNLTYETTVIARDSVLDWGNESGFVGGAVALYDGTTVRLNQDFEHSAGSTVVSRNPWCNIDVVVGVDESVWGLTGGDFTLEKTCSVMTFEAGSTWTAAGNYVHSDGAGGTTTTALTTLPGAESLAAMPNHNVGVILRS